MMSDKQVPLARCVKHGLWIRQSDARKQRIEMPEEKRRDPSSGKRYVIARFHCGPETEHIEEPE